MDGFGTCCSTLAQGTLCLHGYIGLSFRAGVRLRPTKSARYNAAERGVQTQSGAV
jgi:hypothetical protein